MLERLPRSVALGLHVLLGVTALGACSPPASKSEGETSGTSGPHVVAKDYSALARSTMQVQVGKKLFSNCAVCHSAEPGAPSPAGPALAGVLGRKVGSLDDYPYSEALMKADGEWTPEKLDAFLKDPAAVYPGTAMAFGGLAKEGDRRAVVAYLASTGTK